MRLTRLLRVSSWSVSPWRVAGATLLSGVLCFLTPGVLPGTGPLGLVRLALYPVGMLLVSVTVLLSAPLLGRVARAESEAADALRAAAAAGTGGWDREHARFLYMFRVKMVRVLAVGLGSVLLLVSVLTTLLALGRIGADLLEGPETIHVEHCYGPWDRGQAPDGVVVHDDGLTLVGPDGWSRYVRLDGPAREGVRRACYGGVPAQVRMWARIRVVAAVVAG